MADVMKKQTRWNGAVLKPGDPVPDNVNAKTRKRWIAYGIITREKAPETAPEGTETTSVGYEGMKYNKLRALAKERHLDIPARPKRESLIAALEDDDAEKNDTGEDATDSGDGDENTDGGQDTSETGNTDANGTPGDSKKN